MATVAAIGGKVLGGALIKKVAAPVIGSALQGRGARRAAGRAAQQQSLVAEQGISGINQAFLENQAALSPYVGIERQAAEQRAQLLGLSGPEAQRAALQGVAGSPETQFLQEEAEQAILRNQAALGGLGGGRVRQELARQAQGLAQQNIQRRLQNLGGIGVGMTTNLAGLRESQAASAANLRARQGAALATGTLGQAQAQSGMIGGLSKTIGSYLGGKL